MRRQPIRELQRNRAHAFLPPLSFSGLSLPKQHTHTHIKSLHPGGHSSTCPFFFPSFQLLRVVDSAATFPRRSRWFDRCIPLSTTADAIDGFSAARRHYRFYLSNTRTNPVPTRTSRVVLFLNRFVSLKYVPSCCLDILTPSCGVSALALRPDRTKAPF